MACLQSTFTPIGGAAAVFNPTGGITAAFGAIGGTIATLNAIGGTDAAFRKIGTMSAIISPVCGVDLWLYERLLDADNIPILTADSNFILVHKVRRD